VPKSPDLDEFDQLARRGPTQCKVGRLVATLSEKDRKEFEKHLPMAKYQHTVFVKWLAARDLKVSDNVVGLHRAGECCCV